VSIEIWHNPRCSKSRQALALITDAGIEPRVRRYLEDPPSAGELKEALEALGLEPWELARTAEPLAKDLGLGELPQEAEARRQWIEVLCANPKLIERPVVLSENGRGVLGRPPESVQALLGR
jgi:arsenate reductase